ncbi:MAG: hypothetical protein A2540_03575 [Sulfurimonas sp. RIFOXYD2_FULL_37_8]|nr:MAG: hypothetical protein A2540_03575 [Sulfurimonas sp. RIFOXYD2_FULL_37_8]
MEEFEHFAPTLQKDLFENAKNLGLLPDPEYGGGHIHIGLESAFENDDLLFRNFMVDFFNHPEIASGIWKEDLLNAPHLTKLPNEKINRFIELVETFDNGKLNLWDLLWAITNEVYDVNLAPKSWSEDASPDKYQAFNIRRIVGSFAKEEKTAEIRCSKAQNDAFEFLAQIKLLQNRINYLRQLGHPIRPVILKNLSPQQKVDNYFDYITESGGNWRMYKELLHSEYKHLTPEHARNGTLWKNEMLKKLAQTNIEWTEIYRELKGVDIISEDVLEVTTIALKNAKIETIEYQELSTIFNYGHWKNDSLGKNIVNMTEKKLENYNAFPRKIIRSCLGALMNLIWPVSK